MHQHNLQKWRHNHRFNDTSPRSEKNTRQVILLTVIMMTIEIIAGFIYGSMALLADGWHMGTHAAALGITAFAYSYARRNAEDPRYSFGTGKVGVLGGYSSAIILAVVALLMAAESLKRLFSPTPIRFNEAIAVAVIGLAVNLISAFLLQRRDGRSHHHDAGHHHPEDYNLKAAYLHVLADALTSVLAIMALFTGKVFGWIWMDPLMGIVGSAVISRWAYGLLKDTSKILLDRNVGRDTVSAVRAAIESDAESKISDIHIWQVGSHQHAVMISIVTRDPKPPAYYKNLIAEIMDSQHVTIEVNHCKEQ
ncbi:MAG: CDF family Co(II)/Ni(II) efflux transporter DmeF [Desulfobacterales bacterium]|nr:CDF family Co(II)/Ni(II) efflux transporter DmeF [Desulfobacterales bacterium]